MSQPHIRHKGMRPTSSICGAPCQVNDGFCHGSPPRARRLHEAIHPFHRLFGKHGLAIQRQGAIGRCSGNPRSNRRFPDLEKSPGQPNWAQGLGLWIYQMIVDHCWLSHSTTVDRSQQPSNQASRYHGCGSPLAPGSGPGEFRAAVGRAPKRGRVALRHHRKAPASPRASRVS